MTSHTKMGLAFAMGLVLLGSHLFDRDLGSKDSHQATRLRTEQRALLLSPYTDLGLPEIPGTAPDGGPAPKPAQTYTVLEGDTLGRVSQKTLGTTKGWKAILYLNHETLESPQALRVGMRLKIPGPSWKRWLDRYERRQRGETLPRAAIRAPGHPAPVVTPRNTYLVQPGDTLGGIAQKKLGSAGQWKRLLEANPPLKGDPKRLRVGMSLTLPGPPR
ncbi:MAG: LysM peptidoglycan-binding domain-containing protein [Planctomycetota bacterium]|jgi:nucleoid-associated protein YgaU